MSERSLNPFFNYSRPEIDQIISESGKLAAARLKVATMLVEEVLDDLLHTSTGDDFFKGNSRYAVEYDCRHLDQLLGGMDDLVKGDVLTEAFKLVIQAAANERYGPQKSREDIGVAMGVEFDDDQPSQATIYSKVAEPISY